MNYIRQMNGFWTWRMLHTLSHAQTDLYFAILDCANRFHWGAYIAIPNSTLMSMCRTSKSELLRNRRYLQKMNLIRYYPGKVGQAGYYTVVSLEDRGWARKTPDFHPDLDPNCSPDVDPNLRPIIKKKKETEKKKEKINYKTCVSLYETEYASLCQEHGKERAERMLDILNWYKESTGREYCSDYAAIRSWVEARVLSEEEDKKKRQGQCQESFSASQHNFSVYQDNYDHEELMQVAREKLKGEEAEQHE